MIGKNGKDGMHERPIEESAWIIVIAGQYERDRRFTQGVLLEARQLGFRRILPIEFDGQFAEVYRDTDKFKGVPLAVLGHLRDKALVQSLARRGVPCVFFGRDEGLAMRRLAGGRGIVCGTDNAAIGQMAAAYVVGQGRYASYAYANRDGGTRGEKWSSDRRDAFKSELEPHGAHFAGEVCLREGSSNPEKMIASFKEAVAQFPRPLALFACNDSTARDTAMCCDILGIRMPDDIAILGVDNAPAFCETAPVELSSIAPETVRLGRNAMNLVARMLRGEEPETWEVDCPPSHIVERHSTSAEPLEDLFVGKAVDYISAHSDGSISVAKVAKACGTSRRYLERRFKALTGRTILEAIHAKRLAVVQDLLRKPNLSITEIAVETGFSSVSTLCELFRRTYGMSMGEWRRRQ